MPRKSAGSTAGPTTATAETPADTSLLSTTSEPKSPSSKAPKQSTKKDDSDTIGIDELLLPRSLVSRLSRGILPANTSLQKDAVLALTKSATVFISYLAAHANELTSKKTVMSADVFRALEEVELAGVMRLGEMGEDGIKGGYLERQVEEYEEKVRGKRKGYREKVKARGSGGDDVLVEGDREGDEERGEPESKRVRTLGSEEDDLEGDLSMAMDGQEQGNGGQRIRLSLNMNGPQANGHAHEHEHSGIGIGEEVDNDETEPEIEGEDENEDDDQEDEEQDEEEHVAEEHEMEDEDNPVRNGQLRLVPNGREEVMGSEDESD